MYVICIIVVREQICITGEKLTDEEVDMLLQGIEDSQGQVNYEGTQRAIINLCHHVLLSFRICQDGHVCIIKYPEPTVADLPYK